jgi:putative copper export protein
LAKVAVFLLLVAVAARSRVLVRRRLTARAIAGAATGPAPPGLREDAEVGSLWRLRRLVLAEALIAVGVLAVTALLGIATPPTAP